MKKAVKITAAVLAAVSVLAVLALFSPPIIKNVPQSSFI